MANAPYRFERTETILRVTTNMPPPRAEFVERLRADLLAHAGEIPRPMQRFSTSQASTTPTTSATSAAFPGRMGQAFPVQPRAAGWQRQRQPVGRRRRVRSLLLVLALLAGAAFAIVETGLLDQLLGLDRAKSHPVLHVLAEPAQVQREGVSLVVAQVVADSQQTWLSLAVNGAALSGPANSGGDLPPYLILADGSTLISERGFVARGDAMLQAQYRFPPLPQTHAAGETLSATLALPRLPETAPGQAPADWLVPLVLRPADLSKDALALDHPVWISSLKDGASLALVRAARSAEALSIDLALEAGRGQATLPQGWGGLTLTGSSGQHYPLQTGQAEASQASLTAVGPQPGERLTLRLESTPLTVEYAPQAVPDLPAPSEGEQNNLADGSAPGFVFSPGENPQSGQTWTMDATIDLTGGRAQPGDLAAALKVTRARLLKSTRGPGLSLEFEIQPLPGVGSITLYSAADGIAGAFTGEFSGSEPAWVGFEMSKPPQGRLKVYLARVVRPAAGPWEITLQAP